MSELGAIAEDRREGVRAALAELFGTDKTGPLTPVIGGVSAVGIFRFEAGGRPYVMRLERPADRFRDPVRHYACMRIAAEAGIAPPLLHADPATGVSIMAFIQCRPLSDHPGGKAGLAQDLGALLARLQRTETFPALIGYPTILRGLFAHVRGTGLFADGLLDPHGDAFEQLAGAYPWGEEAVSSHNDSNFRNTLYDGERLWMVDWETAYRNDRFVDVAIQANELQADADLEANLVQAWLGRSADARETARLRVMRGIVQFYYAMLIFTMVAAAPRAGAETSVAALSPEAFQAEVMAGRLAMGSPEMMLALGKLVLGGFLATAAAPQTVAAMAALRSG